MIFSELFNYDAVTGLLTWKVSRSNRIKIGQAAGSLQINHKNKSHERHYLHVRLAEGTFLVHRIIFEMMTGLPVPQNKQLDHKDGDGTNNRWGNLRLASRSENMGNRSRNRFRKRDLPKGIGWHNRDCLYTARIADRGVKCSKSLAVARAAYNEAANDYFGEFAKNE